LEVYAGHGTHSSTIKEVLQSDLKLEGGRHVLVERLSIDVDVTTKPTLVANMLLWDIKVSLALRSRYPNFKVRAIL
jgi:hypothetical protein